ncbi:50S ribosomal protein L15 [Salinispira pacifica]
MSELHVPAGATKKQKKLGRGQGSGRGGTAGKGNKGQNSRSGGGVRPGFEGGQMPLYRRIARRGFSNYPFKVTAVAVNLSELEGRFDNGESVNLESLKAKGLVKKAVEVVKILGGGEISKKLKVSGVRISQSAREKIEKAGGTVETVSDSDGQE